MDTVPGETPACFATWVMPTERRAAVGFGFSGTCGTPSLEGALMVTP